MYQFSPTPKHIECVVFESVGGRDNNQGLGIKVRSEPRCACLAAVSFSACFVCWSDWQGLRLWGSLSCESGISTPQTRRCHRLWCSSASSGGSPIAD